MADVIEASRDQPVIVDFWAPWCGPCRQLTPALEKAVTAAKGAVKLVKIDIDKNPAIAGQLRVQSIPAVFAFVGRPAGRRLHGRPAREPGQGLHRPADAARPAAAPTSTSCWRWREESLAAGRPRRRGPGLRPGPAARPEERQGHRRPGALLPGRAATWSGPREIAAMAPADAKDPDLDSVRAALALADRRAVGETAELRAAAGRRPRRPRGPLRARQGPGRPRRAAGGRRPPAEHHRDATATGTTRRRASSSSPCSRRPGRSPRSPRPGRRRLSSILFS